MIYKYEECDLFCVPSSYYLVQCISADFANPIMIGMAVFLMCIVYKRFTD